MVLMFFDDLDLMICLFGGWKKWENPQLVVNNSDLPYV